MAAYHGRTDVGWKEERGQAGVLAILFVTLLLGMAAFVLDVGSWFHSSRSAQATADAAALAGAQALPTDPDQASALAVQYADKNGGGLSESGVTISGQLNANDTINVQVHRSSPSFFAKLLGFGDVATPQQATARAYVPSAALYVAPVTVNRLHPMLSCNPPPCTGATELDLVKLHDSGSGNAAGSFSLIDLDQNDGGSVGSGLLTSWIETGFTQLMPLGIYEAVPSTKYSSSQIQSAFNTVLGQVLLFPVYKPPVLLSGSNAQFNIIGWVGFHITGASLQGSQGKLFGNFTRYIAQGVQATSSGQADFGVETIQLVK